MRKRRSLSARGLFFPAVLLLTALSALPRTPQNYDGPRCSKCKTTGKVPNKFYTPAVAALEKNVINCSWVFEKDKKAHGLPWYPCERCKAPDLAAAARHEFDLIVAKKEKWLARRKRVDEFLGTKLLHLETEHFIIAWDIPKIVTADKKVYKSHEALHLYADRLEKFYDDFMSFFHIEPREVRNKKHYLYLFARQKESLKAAKEYTGLDCWNAAKLPGNPSILVSWYDKNAMPTEADFHRHLVHHVSHLLNVSYYRMEWLASTAGWADEGLAHFFETRYFEKADNTCDEEGEAEDLSHSDWEYEVRAGVEAGTGPSFAEMCNKSTTSLDGREHQLAWSFMDFLLKKYDPQRFKLFMRAVKEKKETRDALREAYDLNVISFQKRWEEYVLANYRDKPLKSLKPRGGTLPKRLQRKH